MEDDEKQEPSNYAYIAIAAAIMLPVFLLFRLFGLINLALPACVCLAAILIVARIRWYWTRHVWFWATIAFVALLHVPVILKVPFPDMTVNRITLLPIGFTDSAIFLGAVSFVRKFIVKETSFDEEQ